MTRRTGTSYGDGCGVCCGRRCCGCEDGRMDRELLIGTYTETLPHVAGAADGILSARFDGEQLTQVALAGSGAQSARG